jgi:hypothetical protein
MEHTWTMNDLLQLNLNTNEAIQQQQQQQQSPQISPVPIKLERSMTNKRPSNNFSIDLNNSSSKRLKTTLSVATSPPAIVVPTLVCDTKTSPQLLQQLMAPLTQAQRAKLKGRGVQTDSNWNLGGGSGGSSANNNQSQCNPHQPSNSVLMNLLVSGCDVSAGYTCLPRPSKTAKA